LAGTRPSSIREFVELDNLNQSTVSRVAPTFPFKFVDFSVDKFLGWLADVPQR
jgi:hypothetical protein